MSDTIKLFDNEYPVEGNYLQYIDTYPSLKMIKNVPKFLEALANNRTYDEVTNFAIGGLIDNKKAIENFSSIKQKLVYKNDLLDDYLDVMLESHKNGGNNKFLLKQNDYDLLKSMNGTLEKHLIEGMNNTNNLYEKIINDYITNEEFPAHFHNISYWLKRYNDLSNGNKPHSVRNILSNEYRSFCFGGN